MLKSIYFNEYVYVLHQKYRRVEVSEYDYEQFVDGKISLEDLVQKYNVVFEGEEPLEAYIFDRYELSIVIE